MSGSIVPIKPGAAPTQISGSNLADMTIYNTSTTQAIWISNSNAVKPNNGLRIGPLGTGHWSKAAGLAWACVDTGVLTPINLNISNDITDPTNPVDVATAVATALLAQGIPNVLTTELLFDGGMSNTDPTHKFDVSGFASVVLGMTGSNLNDDIAALLIMNDPVAGISSDGFYLGAQSMDPLVGAAASWLIPVTHPELQVIPMPTASGSGINVYLNGSNRPTPKLRQLLNQYMPRQLRWNGAFVNGAHHPLTAIDGINDQCTRFNGPCTFTINGNTAANTAGYTITCWWVGITAGTGLPVRYSLQFLPHYAASITVFDFDHPSVPLNWTAQAFAAAAAAQVTLQILPAGAGQ